MTEIAVTTQQFAPGDRPWLLWEGSGPYGSAPTTQGSIDLSLFTLATHYPNGFIPSGIALGKVTTGGRLGPYASGATDGTETCIGFLYNPISTAAGVANTRKIAVAFIDAFAVVSESRLPANHGLDAAAKAELPLIKFRA
jgi:hypothetical protein